KLTLQLGYSHPIEFDPPAGISIQLDGPTKLVVNGFNKELVGQVAANIRGFRPPEPYKGKGIKYAGEYIRRKAGKAAGGKTAKGKVAAGKIVGKALAAKAKEKGIDRVCFDRGGYLYHGRVKAVADGAREGGLTF